MQHLTTFRVQVRAARFGGGERQGAADDVLPGWQGVAAQPSASAGDGNAAGSGGRGRGRVSCGPAGAVAARRSKRVGRFRLTDAQLLLSS